MRPEELRHIRKELDLTQQELADLLGVHVITVARWEAGSRRISEPVAKLVQRIHTEREQKRRKGGR